MQTRQPHTVSDRLENAFCQNRATRIFLWYPPSTRWITFILVNANKQPTNQPTIHPRKAIYIYIYMYRSQRHIKYVGNCVHIRYRYVHTRLLTIATKSKSCWAHYLRLFIECIIVYYLLLWVELELDVHVFVFQSIHSFIRLCRMSLWLEAHTFQIIGTNSYDTNYRRRICNIFWKFQPWSTGNYANKVWRTWKINQLKIISKMKYKPIVWTYFHFIFTQRIFADWNCLFR